MEQKKCNKCNFEKEYIFFQKDNRLKDGICNTCKDCVSDYKKNHYLSNKNKYILKSKIWKNNNIEKVKISDKKSRENHKQENYLRCKIWQENNKERVSLKSRKWQINNKEKFDESRKSYVKNKIINDSLFAFKIRTRILLLSSIKRCGYTKKSKCQSILGCDFLFFKEYIESQFKKGMSWNNIHLDHIKPISIAKTEIEVLELNHYTNFQPLFANENLKKSNKLIEKQLRFL